MIEAEQPSVETFLIRSGSWALLVAGILLLIFCYLHPHSAEQHVDETHFWILVLMLFVPILLLAMAGFTALMLRHQQEMGLTGMVGYIALVATFSAILVLILVQAIAHWGDESHGLELLHHLSILSRFESPGPTLWTMGVMLVCSQLGFSVSISRLEQPYRLPFGVLIIGIVWLFLSLSTVMPALVVEIGAAIYGAGLAWLGWQFRRVGRRAGTAPQTGQ